MVWHIKYTLLIMAASLLATGCATQSTTYSSAGTGSNFYVATTAPANAQATTAVQATVPVQAFAVGKKDLSEYYSLWVAPVQYSQFALPRVDMPLIQRLDSLSCCHAVEAADANIDKVLVIVIPQKQAPAANNTKGKKGSSKDKSASKGSSAAASNPAPTKSVAPAIDNYPLFNSQRAMVLWKKQRSAGQFSQDEFSEAIELCSTAFDYLNKEYQTIIKNCPDQATRMKRYADLDNGKTGEMINFCSIMSRRLQSSGADGQLNDANLVKISSMLEKKSTSKKLLDELCQ